MTILHLITGLQLGGAENQLQQMLMVSSRKHFRHVVVSMREAGDIARELKASGIEVHCLDMARTYPSLGGWLSLQRLLRSLKPDVVHCWMYHACLMGLLAARRTRVPRIVWSLRAAHADLRDYSPGTRMVIRLCAWLSGMPDAQVVNSETSRKVHQKLGYKASGIKVLPNGIDAGQFAPDARAWAGVRQELGVAADSLLVGMFSRYDPMKDHATFLRAAAMLRQRHPELRLVLAGIGITKDSAELTALLRENQLEDAVFLLGPRRDIARLNAALDVACLSSWTESFPNVVVEAMACGVPCVVTDAGDSAFIVGDTGLVAPVRDPEGLAAALESLLSMPAAERIALGQKARERVLARFTMEQCARAYGALYEELAGTLPGTSLTATRSGAV